MAEILLSLTRLQDPRNIVDIALVALLIFLALRLLRGTQAIQLIRGILVIALIFVVISQSMQLTAFNWLLGKVCLSPDGFWVCVKREVSVLVEG